MIKWYYINKRNSTTTTIKNQTEVIEMTNTEKATIILNQLGGNKFTVMTGSKNYLAIENGLRMKLAKNDSGANMLEITVDWTDTYNMRFYKYTPGRLNKKTFAYTDDKITEIKEYSGAYWEQLQELFTGVTGFDTHL